MSKILFSLILSGLTLLVPAAGFAQTAGAPPVFSPPQLDQLVAPIALYPDPLVAQILMASTYPLEVVEAQRWLQDPANAGLQGDQLAQALEQQPWDPSVKSLVPFPQVLNNLNQNIEWTEQLGDAFLAQQAGVMNAVQNLRIEAERSGALRSTPQQAVINQGSYVLIQPANPEIIYVPYYNPAVVYGSWQYPDYEPYYFSDYSNAVGVGLGFGVAVGVIGPLWGWHHWDWRDHRIDIDNRRFASINNGRPPPQPGVWHYDQAHRHGVPFHDDDMRGRLSPSTPQRDDFRGYEGQRPVAAPRAPEAPAGSPYDDERQRRQLPAQPVPQTQPQLQPQLQPRTEARPAVVAGPVQAQEPVVEHPHPASLQHGAPPAFESFPHGNEVREQQARGAQSRMPQMPASQAPHPAPQQAPRPPQAANDAPPAQHGEPNQPNERH